MRFGNRFLIWILFVDLCLFLVGSNSFGGGNTGGGSLVIRSPGETPVLLDFLEIEPGFQDRHSNPYFKLNPSQAEKQRVIRIEQLPIMSLVTERLEKWQTNSPYTVLLLKIAMKGMRWGVTVNPVRVLPEYHLPSSIPLSFPKYKINGAIVYEEGFGARISIPAWNSLGEMSQAGLIVHEALRHIQIHYGSSLSNEKLQKVVAKIMLNNPSLPEELDRSEDYFGNRQDLLSKKEAIGSDLLVEMPNACSELNETDLKKDPRVSTICQALPTEKGLEAFIEILSVYLDSDPYMVRANGEGDGKRALDKLWGIRNRLVSLLLEQYAN
jgi:hypothetical protein